MKGYLVLERDKTEMWGNLSSDQSFSLINYAGFDGARWPLYDKLKKKDLANFDLTEGIALFHDEQQVQTYFDSLPFALNTSFELLILDSSTIVNEKLNFMGYDIGVIYRDDEPIFFSGIISELQNQENNHFEGIVEKLNKNFLFNTVAACNEYMRCRDIAIENRSLKNINMDYKTEEFEIVATYLKKRR